MGFAWGSIVAIPYLMIADAVSPARMGVYMGLINAFDAVANAAPAEKSNLLTASIAEAMNCTSFGLMVAIPLLVINLFLTTKASRIVDSLEIISLKTLNVIFRHAGRKQQMD